jgi:hypothetical protein
LAARSAESAQAATESATQSAWSAALSMRSAAFELLDRLIAAAS